MAFSNYPDPLDPDYQRHQQAISEVEKRIPSYLKQPSSRQTQHVEMYTPGEYTAIIPPQNRDINKLKVELISVKREVMELKARVDNLTQQPAFVTSKIHSLPSEEYELKAPIDVIIEIYSDEALAVIPELELYGEGRTEMDALSDLKLELIDLYENLVDMSDDELGDSPREWKKTLQLLVVKCQ